MPLLLLTHGLDNLKLLDSSLLAISQETAESAIISLNVTEALIHLASNIN